MIKEILAIIGVIFIIVVCATVANKIREKKLFKLLDEVSKGFDKEIDNYNTIIMK